MEGTRPPIVPGIAVAVTVGFLCVLGYLLFQPGYRWTRLAFSAVLGGLAVLSTVGVVYGRTRLAAGSAFVLFLLGFYQAALWLYIWPTAIVLFIGSFLRSSNPRTGGQSSMD